MEKLSSIDSNVNSDHIFLDSLQFYSIYVVNTVSVLFLVR